ncbi:MAG: hypothetical protein AAF570_09935, partial [Bacteroidota bacterium]
FRTFASSDLPSIYGADALTTALRFEARELRSLWFENKGAEGFAAHPLPTAAQTAPVRGILVRDFDSDGHLDLLLAGNDYAPEVETIRQDAGIGTLLRGDGKGNWSVVDHRESGFFAPGDVRSLAIAGPHIIVARNNARPLLFRWKK